MTGLPADLPIETVLVPLRAALAAGTSSVLVAPPGAGKTTRVPLALLAEAWALGRAGKGRLILLEPRRLAARAAASRMADTLGESVGQTVGLRVRLQSLISAQTRIEVVTEGVFARMIIDDPGLEGITGVLFDEFHERSLDADLGLALALDAQKVLREDLRIIIMSATLDGARVARLLGDAPVIESAGRAFPVETLYLPRDPRERIEDAMARAIVQAAGTESGSILAFLPGQAEIARTASLLSGRFTNQAVTIAPLHGGLDFAAQDRAVKPAKAGERKIVLATSIAETSLTIEGVRIVIDSGLARVPRYEPDIGLTRLETVRVSRAAADQRRGRAGRTQPGICYRLWDQAGTGAMPVYATPEILSADLSSLVLDLALWGVREANALDWLDPPPAATWAEARALLVSLGALDADGAITSEGRALRALALPPRLARMVLDAARLGAGEDGARMAVLLSERGLGGPSADLAERLEHWSRDRSPRANDARKLASRFAREAGGARRPDGAAALSPGRLVAFAFPDRLAKARGKTGTFLMANGRAASLEPHESLAREQYLAIAEVGGRAGQTRIFAAAAISEDELMVSAGDSILQKDETLFDAERGALRRQLRRTLGAITLSAANLAVEPGPAAAAALAAGVAALGIDRLAWSAAQVQLRARVAFIAAQEEGWPDLSDQGLAKDDAAWLAPFIEHCTSLAAIDANMLGAALDTLLPWDVRRRLDAQAPTHFETPAGSRIALDYSDPEGVGIAVRVQELFGLATHPVIGRNTPLTLHLLSPAHRPIQITRDLPRFWAGSWADVRADLRGRYPRHSWPEDPANAQPTARAKPKGT